MEKFNITFDRDDLLDALYAFDTRKTSFTIFDERYFDDTCSERENFYDAYEMIVILRSVGIEDISQRDVMTIWSEYSHSHDGVWVTMPGTFKRVPEENVNYFLQVCEEFVKRYGNNGSMGNHYE